MMEVAPNPGSAAAWRCRQPILRLHRIGVCYGKNWALRDVSLDIWRGDRIAFIGPNGAGKTSLLKSILGLVPLAEGAVLRAQAADRVAYVPQKLHLPSDFPLTVGEFMAISHPDWSAWFGGLPSRLRPAIMDALDQLNVGALVNQTIGTLSGGQLQKVLLASAMLRTPGLLLLDEPSASIDQRGTEELGECLAQLQIRKGLTILFVTHDIGLVRMLASRVVCLNKNLIALGSPEEVLSQSPPPGGDSPWFTALGRSFPHSR